MKRIREILILALIGLSPLTLVSIASACSGVAFVVVEPASAPAQALDPKCVSSAWFQARYQDHLGNTIPGLSPRWAGENLELYPYPPDPRLVRVCLDIPPGEYLLVAVAPDLGPFGVRQVQVPELPPLPADVKSDRSN